MVLGSSITVDKKDAKIKRHSRGPLVLHTGVEMHGYIMASNTWKAM